MEWERSDLETQTMRQTSSPLPPRSDRSLHSLLSLGGSEAAEEREGMWEEIRI